MRQDFVDKLELELRSAGERRARPWRIARRQLLTPALAALGVAAIAVALAATVLRSDDTIPAEAPPRLIADTALVSQAGTMASAFGSVWVADIDRERLLRLDPRTRAVEARIPLGMATFVDAAAGSVWALGVDRLLRIDPSSNRVVAAIPAPGSGARDGLVLEGRGNVWIAYPQALARVDLRRNEITRRVPISRAGFRAVGAVSDGRIIYVTRADGRLLRVDARTGKRLSAVRSPAVGALLGVAGGTVFVGGEKAVAAIDAASGRTRWTRDLRANAGVLRGGTLWVHASDKRDRLWRLDARTGRATGSLALPEFGAASMVAAGEQVWTMSVGGHLQVAR
jgi:virginiamycin B lyase